jgi:hypothetical protein
MQYIPGATGLICWFFTHLNKFISYSKCSYVFVIVRGTIVSIYAVLF